MIQPVYKWVSKIKQQQQPTKQNWVPICELIFSWRQVHEYTRVLNTPGEITPTTSDCRENGDTVQGIVNNVHE